MWSLFFALLSGAILPLAFAPFGISAIAFISPAILFYLWLNATSHQAFWRGLLFGLGFFGIGVSWVFVSINTYGNTPLIISILVTLLFILYLSLFPALQGLIVKWLFKNKSDAVLCLGVFPASWVLFEILRSTLFTGFPWLPLGSSQMNTPLQGLAPLFGVYGVSLAVAYISASLALLGRYTSYAIKFSCVAIIVIITVCGWSFTHHAWTKPSGPAMHVSLVQGNIAQEMKWDPAQIVKTLKIYKTMTEKNWGSQLIVWPEAAVPTFPQDVQQYLASLKQEAQQHQAYIVYGAPYIDVSTHRYYNALLLTGLGNGIYLKRHLVPFGEYFPLKSLFGWFINRFQIPMSNFSPGPKYQEPMTIDHTQIAAFICYESAFPFEVLDDAQNKNLLITVSDDSWFGRSIALPQHLEMAQMRALEAGRYLLQATNTGLTAVINPFGKIIALAPFNQPYVLNSSVIPMSGATPLMRWHYYPIYSVTLLLLLISFFRKKSRANNVK